MIKEFCYKRETIKTYIPKQSYKKSYVLKRGTKTWSNFEIIAQAIKRFNKKKINYSVAFEGIFLILSSKDIEYKVRIKE